MNDHVRLNHPGLISKFHHEASAHHRDFLGRQLGAFPGVPRGTDSRLRITAKIGKK
jgi:hypothetical protein